MKMIVILYNDMDVIAPYATNEPLRHRYTTIVLFFFFFRSFFITN